MTPGAFRGGGRCGVVVAESGDLERVTDGHRERRKGAVEEAGRHPGARVTKLPEIPEAIDHAVVGPEDRVVGRGRDALHRPPGPDVDAVVDRLELGLEGEEVAVVE